MASNLALPPLPDNFKPVGHLLKTAFEHESRDAVVAYWARLAALQSAMVIDKKSKEAKAVLIPLMDWLEKEKKVLSGNEAVSSEIVASAHIENYAMKLFEWADKEDRAARFGKNVVKSFYTAGNLFDIMHVFGELTPEILHARKYSKWKAAYIHNCLKKGETPIPGPVGGDSEENETNEGGAGGWAQPPSNVDQVQPNLPSSTVVPPPVALQPAMPQPVSTESENSNPSTGASMDPQDVSRVQKLCKFASSSLDYDDIDAAIKNLSEALDLLHKSKQK